MLRKYKFPIATISALVLLLLVFPDVAKESLGFAAEGVGRFLLLLPPIFVIVGLLDTWVERETLIRHMGADSGVRGMLLSLFLGLVTAVPLYALLPIAALMLKKGCKVANVLLFLTSCSAIRIPLLLFLTTFMGVEYAALWFAANLVVVFAISVVAVRILPDSEIDRIYETAEAL